MRAGVIALLLWCDAAMAAASPAPILMMAAEPGVQAPDSVDGQPGNPFATAFLELLRDPTLTLAAFGERLRRRTAEISGGVLTPDVPLASGDATIRLGAPAPGERRVALVIIHARYTDGWAPLEGAAHDATRVHRALTAAGFDTRLLVDPTRQDRSDALAKFAEASEAADVAIVYATGHGVMDGDQAFLLDSDFVRGWRQERLAEHALPVAAMAATLKARRANLMLFGGCRTYEWW